MSSSAKTNPIHGAAAAATAATPPSPSCGCHEHKQAKTMAPAHGFARPAVAVVAREAWVARRVELLEREKALSRAREELAAERRKLPMVKVGDADKYAFDTEHHGRVTLRELFHGRPQLMVYHFMFDDDWEQGCLGCSITADTFNGSSLHLPACDVTFVAVSKAPLPKLLAFKERMGWTFPWVSSSGSPFNADFHVSFPTASDRESGEYNFRSQGYPQSEGSGISVFWLDAADGAVYHTYSAYARGGESLINTYDLLDLVPLGRQERVRGNEGAGGKPAMWFAKRHDEYPYYDAKDMGATWL